eukprot:COSAG06_NODE_42227_length_383_cov_2.922535_1_plen_21_part_01
MQRNIGMVLEARTELFARPLH